MSKARDKGQGLDASPIRATRGGERDWVPPVEAEVALRLPKRERLELVKPILREHRAMRVDGMSYDQPPGVERRWNWIYHVLGERVGQARGEIENEDEYGHYWSPAWVDVVPVSNGPIRYEVEVNYPKPIRVGRERKVHSEQQKCLTRWGANRWANRRRRAYERYIKRLLREGVYDEYGYGR